MNRLSLWRLMISLALLILANRPFAFGQLTENQDLSKTAAHDLYIKHHYSPARNAYSPTVPMVEYTPEADAETDYHRSVSAAQLQHSDAAVALEQYLSDHPTSTRSNEVWLQLGHLYFRNNSFRSALDAYQHVSPSGMNAEENAEFVFKRGYTFLKSGDIDKASADFARIKDKQTKYTGPANYYYAHLMYEAGNYETALRDFEKLRNDETFKSVVPYYIIQIYYVQGRYDEMLTMAEPYLKSTKNKRTTEMLRLVADVKYRRGEYKDAIKYMEEYAQTSRSKMTREDRYVLGFAYYATQEYKKAIPEFQSVTTENDTLAQNAWYHLGLSYLQTNQKQFASNAFSSAWKVPIRTELAEESLFNYAKLSVELSNNPYNDAIKALQQYLSEYPDSRRRDEAYTYLANLYVVTKNYAEALNSLELIRNRNASQNAIYQKITYFRGIELFQAGDYQQASALFQKSLQNKTDRSIAQGAQFWLADAQYRMGNYTQAAATYRDYLTTAQGHASYNAANYNLGYSYFKLNDYSKAQKAFANFISSKPSDQRLLNDARLRQADCYMMLRQYREASDLYAQVGNARAADADYALFSRSVASGVLGDHNGKINTLQKLIADFPASPYADDARFEMGKTYQLLRKNNDALDAFQKLIKDYPRSSFVKDALLNAGLIYYNTERDKQALETLKKVVADYPSTPAAREALSVIRNIYVDINKVDEYVAYAEGVPFADVSRSEQDSLLYSATESRYMSGDCEKALPGFTQYLLKFPDGSFSLNALYFKADCQIKSGDKAGAVDSYRAILQRPRNIYTENAALRASALLFEAKNFSEALDMYRTLEENAENKTNITIAVVGQMRCNYETGNFAQTIMYAQRVLDNPATDNTLAAEAWLLNGRASLNLRRTEQARTAFNETVKLSKGAQGAEALYHLAQIAFDMRDYATSESTVFRLSSDYPAYHYWLAKGFILLSDIYVLQGNTFQARQTIQSIIDNYEGEDLRKIATDKMKAITDTENTNRPAGSDNEADESIIIK